MDKIAWSSVGFYCAFSIFLFYQQLHAKNFRGGSVGFGFALSISAAVGTVVGLAYLGYYGWNVGWWAAVMVCVIGVIATFIGFFVERLLGAGAISFIGFLAWPFCAYFMFKNMPIGH